MKAERKEVDAVITSATELTATHEEDLGGPQAPPEAGRDGQALGGWSTVAAGRPHGADRGQGIAYLSAATKIGAISRAL